VSTWKARKLDYAQSDTRKFAKEFLELKIERENDIKISSTTVSIGTNIDVNL